MRVVSRVSLGVLVFGLLAASALNAQGAPIIGRAPVTLRPSTSTPLVNGTFTMEVLVDLSGLTGTAATGGTTGAVAP